MKITRFTRTVAMKYGMQALPETKIQSHMLSIHSPHSTRKTIMKLRNTHDDDDDDGDGGDDDDDDLMI